MSAGAKRTTMTPRITITVAVLCLATASMAALPATKGSKGTVTGVAIDANKDPVAGCVVSATEAAQRMRVAKTAETDKDGKFTIDLTAGSWTLTATTKDVKFKGVKSVDVEPGEKVDAGKIVLRPRTVGAR